METYSFVIRGPTKNSVTRFVRTTAINYAMAVEKMLTKFQNRFIRIKKPMDLKNALKEVAKRSKATKTKTFYVNNVDGECEISETMGNEPLAAYRNGGEIALPSKVTAPKKVKETDKVKVTNLTHKEFKVFKLVYDKRSPVPIIDISEETGIIVPEVSKAVQSLESKGMVSQKLDGNQHLVFLTPYGDSIQMSKEFKQELKQTNIMKTKTKKSSAKKVAKKVAKRTTAKKVAKKRILAPKEGAKIVDISIKDMRANIKKGYTYRDPQGVIQSENYLSTRAKQDHVRTGMQEFKPAKK